MTSTAISSSTPSRSLSKSDWIQTRSRIALP
jgi:hypothetical protein